VIAEAREKGKKVEVVFHKEKALDYAYNLLKNAFEKKDNEKIVGEILQSLITESQTPADLAGRLAGVLTVLQLIPEEEDALPGELFFIRNCSATLNDLTRIADVFLDTNFTGAFETIVMALAEEDEKEDPSVMETLTVLLSASIIPQVEIIETDVEHVESVRKRINVNKLTMCVLKIG
jgi:hypothetical protein